MPATGATGVAITAVGGAGGDGSGNNNVSKGDAVTATFAVGAGDVITPGETLFIEVGGNGATGNNYGAGGANGGGSGAVGGLQVNGGGGGGASDVRSCSATTCTPLTTVNDSRILVAGGGGGAGGCACAAGAGGNAGQNGSNGTSGVGGGAGTATTFGQGGAGGGSGIGGTNGALGTGGNGGYGVTAGGGGGGGYYGGGGGGGSTNPGYNAGAGGGGGSDFVKAGGTTLSEAASSLAPSVTITLLPAASGVSLTASQNPSQAGQPVTFTAVVSCAASPDGGTVDFEDASVSPPAVIGSAPVSGGVAVLQTSSLSVGAHSIVAVFEGDAFCNGSTSNALPRQVLAPAGAVQLTSSANPSDLNQAVTFTATVSCFQSGETITFLDGNTVLATKSLNNRGVAKLTTSSLSAGRHSITAAYPGDTNCLAATSAALTQTVNGVPTQNGGVILTSSANPSRAGSPVTFTAYVTCSGYAPAGTVTFTDGSATLGAATVNGAGQASLRVVTLTAGSHTITATVSGSPCGPLTSAPLTQTVH